MVTIVSIIMDKNKLFKMYIVSYMVCCCWTLGRALDLHAHTFQGHISDLGDIHVYLPGGKVRFKCHFLNV